MTETSAYQGSMTLTDIAKKSIIALACVEELALKKKRELLVALPSPEEWTASKNSKTLTAILGDETKAKFLSKFSRIDDIIERTKASECSIVTFFDETYPETLRTIDAFPLVLFTLGNQSLLNSDCIAVVGTRTPTRYGAKVCDSFTREFSRAGLCVVSGFARGVDTIAHKACVELDAPTIAVFASGVDYCYPPENKGLKEAIIKSGGLIMSEYQPGTRPLQYHFPERNRIISGLARGVFIPEATSKSGSLITARCAVEQGKELFVVPGNINSPESEGTNRLLQEMPHALTIEAQDVFDRLNICSSASPERSVYEMNMTESLIIESLHDHELHFEELLEISGLAVGELTTTLMNLELNGIIEQTSGNYYSLA